MVDGDAAAIESHADQYMTLLVKSQNWREALELYEDTVTRRSGLDDARGGQHRSAGAGGVPRRQSEGRGTTGPRLSTRSIPNHPDIPRAYLLGAQLMADYGNQPEDAKRIFQYLVKRHAGDPAAVEAERHLEVMRRMAK